MKGLFSLFDRFQWVFWCAIFVFSFVGCTFESVGLGFCSWLEEIKVLMFLSQKFV